MVEKLRYYADRLNPKGCRPMPDQPSFPSLSDDELRETLELLSTVMASVSDRVDDQTKALDRINKTATEARQAAFAAKAQTDPKHYGELVGRTIDGKINDNLIRMGGMIRDLFHASNKAQDALKKAEDDQLAILGQVRDRENKADRLKRALPWFGLGAVVLALALSVALPRFMASYPATCAVIGGIWRTTTTGVDACVFYRP
jgi:ABC-type transporter Mla subunit MlaD